MRENTTNGLPGFPVAYATLLCLGCRSTVVASMCFICHWDIQKTEHYPKVRHVHQKQRSGHWHYSDMVYCNQSFFLLVPWSRHSSNVCTLQPEAFCCLQSLSMTQAPFPTVRPGVKHRNTKKEASKGTNMGGTERCITKLSLKQAAQRGGEATIPGHI